MALTLRSGYLDELKSLDRQHSRENAGKGRIDPKWAQNKRKIPSVDSIRRDEPVKFVGGYGPKATKHPTGEIALKPKPWLKTEGDVPFDSKLESEAHKNYRQVKESKSLFPGYGSNPQAVKDFQGYGELGGKPPVSQKLSKPVITSRPMVEGRKFNTLRPPLQRSSLGGFEQMVRGWVK